LFKQNVIYEASICELYVHARLYFTFDYDYHRVTLHDAHDVDWRALPVGDYGSLTVVHSCAHGDWLLQILKDDMQWWYKKQGKKYIPTISKPHEDDPQLRAAINNELKEPKEKQFADINREIRESIREKCSTRSVKDVSLSKETLEKAKDALFGHTPFYDMLSNPYSLTVGEQECYESLKKGDDKMSKYLWHVILFNTDTEQIDFKGYIPASSGSDAQMLAAQTFGKFDPKVHAVNCKQIMSYGKED